ncbi:MAG: 23S rRNA (uracil(1939)-C(5))-methyltransferase RlmD [Syntrophaceae bacterium]|nr:23S rRNA (uracil(1939)-C(5))-methyltransferase RlmD [Syntrophaceae bacterium]
MAKKIRVRIESVAFKGYGVARVQGKVVFVPHTMTGDEAWIELMEEKKRYSMGRIVQMIKPAPWRVTPLCPSFGVCGGCQWQHIDYCVQGELKEKIFKDILIRLGGLKEIPPVRVFPSPKSYGYRSRVQLKVQGEKLGYLKQKTHQIVEIQECPIAHPIINQMLPSIRKMSSSFSQTKEIEINVSPDEGKGVLLLHFSSSERGIENVLKDFLQNHLMFKGIVMTKKEGNAFCGDPALNLTISLNHKGEGEKIKFRISPGSFSQINLEQNQRLIQTVLQFSEAREEETVLDLYAGVGNLTLPLALVAKKVFGIEENKVATEDARFNAEQNRIRNCDLIHGRTEEVLENWERESPDCIVLDPPRIGCKTVLDQMVRLKPKRMVYVSCDPTTFSRDLRRFNEKGYVLQKLSLIDMFPQSYHMEVVGLLNRS